MSAPTTVATNLGAVVETPTHDQNPYRVDVDGRPYLPVGDGGLVLGLRLGDGVFDSVADHAAPGACLVHSDAAARLALTSLACLGNDVTVRSGAAAGAHGTVLGKRGEQGRVIACFAPADLARLLPGDGIVVRGAGQGSSLLPPLADNGVVVLNVSPAGLQLLPVDLSGTSVHASVRGTIGSHVVGNGIGRPAHQWDLDLQIGPDTSAPLGVAGLRLGDLVAVNDLDVRHNVGYRRGWTTLAIVVHGGSPQPGHGPGVMPVLCGPNPIFEIDADPATHHGITETALLAHHDRNSL